MLDGPLATAQVNSLNGIGTDGTHLLLVPWNSPGYVLRMVE